MALSGLTLVTAGVLALNAAEAPAATTPGGRHLRVTTSELQPVPITVRTRRPGTAPGLLFVSAESQSPLDSTSPRGPEIVDDHGRPVWFNRLAEGHHATDFRVQTYRGRKVLTWWEGAASSTGVGQGIGYIADENYQIIATVKSADPLDLHEFRLTPQGTALVIVYRLVTQDLSLYGGPKNGTVIDSIIREIDIATGRELFSWSGLDHVPISESDMLGSAHFGTLDYMHVNSVDLDTDGNLIISARHSSTVYKIDRRTGEIIWRLGGHASTFRQRVGARFHWQHDVIAEGSNTYRIFDNAEMSEQEGYEARVVWVKVDPVAKVATLVRQDVHPQLITTGPLGGSQKLPNNDTLVGWGTGGGISEFSPHGSLLFDATFPKGFSTYRAYRFDWRGRPATDPTVTVDNGSTVHAVWNGATGVARWRVLGGESQTDLKRVAQAAWNGLDTSIQLPADTAKQIRYVEAEALDATGKAIGRSPITATGS